MKQQITLTLDLPAETVRWLECKADRDGIAVDAVAAELVRAAVHHDVYGQGWPLDEVQRDF